MSPTTGVAFRFASAFCFCLANFTLSISKSETGHYWRKGKRLQEITLELRNSQAASPLTEKQARIHLNQGKNEEYCSWVVLSLVVLAANYISLLTYAREVKFPAGFCLNCFHPLHCSLHTATWRRSCGVDKTPLTPCMVLGERNKRGRDEPNISTCSTEQSQPHLCFAAGTKQWSPSTGTADGLHCSWLVGLEQAKVSLSRLKVELKQSDAG